VTDSAAQTLDGIDVYATAPASSTTPAISPRKMLVRVGRTARSYTLDFVDEAGRTQRLLHHIHDVEIHLRLQRGDFGSVASADVGNIDIALRRPSTSRHRTTLSGPLSNIEVDLNSTSSNAIRGARPSGTTDGGDVTYTDDDGDYSFAVAPGTTRSTSPMATGLTAAATTPRPPIHFTYDPARRAP